MTPEQIKALSLELTALIIDEIVTDVVRPGYPEERECVDLAVEMREYAKDILPAAIYFKLMNSL